MNEFFFTAKCSETWTQTTGWVYNTTANVTTIKNDFDAAFFSQSILRAVHICHEESEKELILQKASSSSRFTVRTWVKSMREREERLKIALAEPEIGQDPVEPEVCQEEAPNGGVINENEDDFSSVF